MIAKWHASAGYKCLFIQLILFMLLCTPAAADEPDPNYWRLAAVEAQFDAWEAAYPGLFYQMPGLTSGQGKTIPVARISNSASDNLDRPGILFHAAQHANECNGTTAIMKTIESLLTGYGVDDTVTDRIKGLELWFIPILNLDGHNYVFGGGSLWQDWRKTLRDNNNNCLIDFPDDGVDLNRNWDWRWNEYDDDDPISQKFKGPQACSESEVVGLRDFILAERPVVVVDYHSPVTIAWKNTIFWPWHSTQGNGDSPDSPVARSVAENWAATTDDENGNNYRSFYGFDTLPKEQCWVYGNTGILTFIVEISDHCWWTGAMVDTIGNRVARGSNTLMDRVADGPGIYGSVTDSDTDNMLIAEIVINELHGPEVGPRYTDPTHGTYHRLTEQQSYTVTANCPGYLAQTIQVNVVNTDWYKANFSLAPVVAATDNISSISEPDNWLKMPNPAQAGQKFQLSVPAGVHTVEVELFDLRGRRLEVMGHDLRANRTHNLQLPYKLPTGVYLVRASSGDQQQVKRISIVH